MICHNVMHESVQAEGLLLLGQQALKLKWRSGRLYDATLPGIYMGRGRGVVAMGRAG